MNQVERLRLEKVAADCGFEMTPGELADGIEMRSARFPEAVLVRMIGYEAFHVTATDPFILGMSTSAIDVGGFGELYKVLRAAAVLARTRPNRVANEFRERTAALPKNTEAERLVVQRVGQGLFRSALLDYWQGLCCVTGLDVADLLKASHIKPWAKCESDDERLDVFNGLLLAPHIDALFDGGWISFSEDGHVLISDSLSFAARQRLGVSNEWGVRDLSDAHQQYLTFHREHELRA